MFLPIEKIIKFRRVWKDFFNIFCLFLILSTFLVSATQYHPKLKWKEIHTEHFIIYFHQGEEEYAQYLANLAERVHKKLTSYFPWKPEGKTRVILIDSFDISNGYSTPIPYNIIGIYLIPPPGYSQIGCWDEWLNLVFTHEYVHTIQLDACGKIGKILRKISGRTPTFLHFPNLYLPIWSIEGLAVMGETLWTNGGRGRAGDFDMILRAEAKEGVYPRIDWASTFPDSWPGGISPYLYGGKFMIYLKEKYGDEKLKELFESLSKNLIPYTSDWNFGRIYGKPFKQLWKEWFESYIAETDKIKNREPIIPVEAIKEVGFELLSPVQSMDGKIFFISINPNEFPKIKSFDLKNKRIEDVAECYYGNKLTLSKDGRFLIFDQLDYYQSFSLYSDLYMYDLEKREGKRITKGMRLKEPEFDPSTEKVIAIKYELKKTELVEIGLDGKDLKKIFSDDNIILSSPSISPDKKLIALSANRGGNWDILLIGRNGEFIKWITQDKFRDITPSFSKSGKYIVFSSDRDGFFNLYLYDIEKDKIFQITNLITGAFHPYFLEDEKEILFLEYYRNGYRISKIKFLPEKFKEVENFEKEEGERYVFFLEKKYTIKKYNPVSSLKPAYWIPSLRDGGDETQYGVSVAGNDPLERNIYYIDLHHGFQSKRWSGSLVYIYDALYPTISSGYSNTSDLHSSGGEKYILQREKFFLRAVFPFYRVRESSFLIGEFRRETGKYNLDKDEKLNLSGLRFGILFNNSRKYPFSISPAEGRRLSILLEKDIKELGSDYNIWKFTGEWKEFLKLPLKHHVLGIRFIYGKSWGERRRVFFMGGYEGNTSFAMFDTNNFNLLRGYKKDSIYGTEALLLNIEYRLPLLNVERGYQNFPIFLRRFHLAPFLDVGNAWIDSFRASELKKGVGIELRGDLIFSYFLPLTFSIGYARGIDRGGEDIAYFRLSNSF